MTIKLIVLDVDGVLARGEGHPFDLTLMDRLAKLNQQSKEDEAFPAVTLNTGRPSPYVEAVMQAISGWQPALYESGAGLFHPTKNLFESTPLLTDENKGALQTMIEFIDKQFVQTGKAYWQPGKTVCYSLFAIPPLTINLLTEEVSAFIAQTSDDFIATPAEIALNIQPKHIDKGTGLTWLSNVTGIDPSAMAGAGDSQADADFLKLIGYPAAPVNATDDVKAVAAYTSSYATTAGLHDILDHWGL